MSDTAIGLSIGGHEPGATEMSTAPLRSGDIIPIWPGAAPGSETWTWQEQEMDSDGDRIVRNVTIPTLQVVMPDRAANGTGIIVAPGGAFHYLMLDYEGIEVAAWLADRGVTAFLLRYRVRHTPEDDAEMRAFKRRFDDDLAKTISQVGEGRLGAETDRTRRLGEEDGRQAIRCLRSRAAAFGLDAQRIGIMGFSAGGSVSYAASVAFDEASRPDFTAALYGLPPDEYTVSDNAPPIFLGHAGDDPLIPADASVRAWQAWTRAGVSAELHVFRTGGHGFGMKHLGLGSDAWTGLFDAWLRGLGLIEG